MTVRLTRFGVEDTLTGEDILWLELAEVTASAVDHMTQRVPVLSFTGFDGTEISVGEGSSGWDAVVEGLGERIELPVPHLSAAVSMLRTGEVLTLRSRR